VARHAADRAVVLDHVSRHLGSERTEILSDVGRRDVVVIGAGPAGALTAERLARRGHDVVVLEEHARPGVPVHCTGLLGLDAFAEFDLPKSLVLAHAGTARFWGAAGQSVAVRSGRVHAAIIDRAGLDALLAGRADAAGATVLTGCRAEAVEVETDGVRVTTRAFDRPIRARACVIACGANYRFHRPLGLGFPHLFLQSAQIETRLRAPLPAEIEVRFGRDVAPGGFAWVVPFTRGAEPYARVGLMSETRSRQRFEAFVRILAARTGAVADPVGTPGLKMLPLGPVARTYADRVLAVGDAAGLVKPTTGGGIYYGMLSGALAADVLDDGLRSDRLHAGRLRRYETMWRRRLGPEIRVATAFRRLAARFTDATIDSIIDLARVDGVVPLLQDTASFNWHRKAAVALLGHPAFRRIVLKSWTRSDGLI
jgi:geranylgeranyl reductase family protein